MIAVIETGGKQYLIKEGDTLSVEKLPVEAGQEVEFDKVLLTAKADGSDLNVGTPYLEGVTIKADLTDQYRAKKIRVIKYKAKVRYKKVYGHRQHQSKVKIKTLA